MCLARMTDKDMATTPTQPSFEADAGLCKSDAVLQVVLPPM